MPQPARIGRAADAGTDLDHGGTSRFPERAVPAAAARAAGERTLDVACGNAKTPGAVGIDLRPGSDADLLCDVERTPWPLASDSFDRVVCAHVLEHVRDVVAVMAEVHRVARDGARVVIETPHFTSLNSWDDPTHRHHFSLQSFDFFVDQDAYWNNESPRFELVSKHVSFGSSLLDLIPKLLVRISRRTWEKHFAFVLPALNLRIELTVRKAGAGPPRR